MLQNENGPCPLLAAVNCLLLKGVIRLPSHCIRNSVASLQDVVNLLAEQAMTYSNNSNHSDHSDNNHSFLDELLQVLPTLQYGMDVNPKFTQGITGYEYTSQLSAFDMLRVRLVHGWLLDPSAATASAASDDHNNNLLAAAVDNKSYNQVVELIIQGKESEDLLSKVHQQMEELRVQASKLLKQQQQSNLSGSWDMVVGAVDHASEAAAAASTATATGDAVSTTTATATAASTPATATTTTPAATPATATPASTTATATVADNKQETPASLQLELDLLQKKYDALSKQATTAHQIEDFLNHTSHQLTHYGLGVLYEAVQEGEFCVFFRNNHFGTLTKHKSVLYLLATDLGYAHTPDIVWEKLDMIDGDTELVNSQFQRGAMQTDLLSSGPALAPEQLLAQSGQNDADYHLALHLSMEQQQQGLTPGHLDAQEGKLVAAATEASLREYHGIKDGTGTGTGTGGVGADGHIEVGVPVNPLPGGTVAALPSRPGSTTEDADRLLAMQLQADQDPHSEDASLRLAQQLQAQENQRQQARAPARTQSSASSTASKCVIS